MPGPGALIDPIEPELTDASGGLVQSAQVVLGGTSQDDRRWETGFQYRPKGGCGPAQRWMPCSGAPKADDVNATVVSYTPFTVLSRFKCSSVGLTEEERQEIAETSLDWYQGDQIELELWRADLSITSFAASTVDEINPFLANAGTVNALTTVGTTEVAPLMYGLADLQQALRECLGSKRRGVIHCSTKLASLWDHLGGLHSDDDGRIRDPFGNLIVCGAGYDGSSPTVVAGNGTITSGGTTDPTGRTEWAYATGPVVVRLGPVEMTPDNTVEAFDRQINDITFEAHRTAAAYFDPCCHVGINVDLCHTACS